MIRKMLFVCMLCAFLSAVSAGDGDFWICPGAETALYGVSGLAYGGGVSLGYGKGVSIGFKVAYFYDPANVNIFEIGFLLRWFFWDTAGYSGPFVQFSGGPVFFITNNSSITVPGRYAAVATGAHIGWRFRLGEKWFIEPAIRAGYPYIAGAALFAGFYY